MDQKVALASIAFAAVVAGSAGYITAQAVDSDKQIAVEGQAFTTDVIIKYGASGKFATKTYKVSGACDNSNFTDPSPGAAKACYVTTSAIVDPVPTPTPTPAPTPSAIFPGVLLGKEGSTFTLTKSTIVRYGANGKFVEKTLTGSVVCNNTIFNDPIPGIAKSCYDAAGTVVPVVPNPTPAPSNGAGITTTGYDTSAYLVTLANKGSLQSLLDSKNTIRLEAGDYKNGGPSGLRLKSGQKIYGLPKTDLPNVTVAAGTEGAVLSNVSMGNLIFEPSGSAVTRNNLFRLVWTYSAIAKGARLENNLFLDWFGVFDFDQSAGGFSRGNRFIKGRAQGQNEDYVRFKGNSTDISSGNTFVFYNFLTPGKNGSELTGQKDMTFVGLDAESWNWNNLGRQAVVKTDNTVETLRIFAANGGDNRHAQNAEEATGYFDIGAKNFLLFNDIADTRARVKTRIAKSVENAILINVVNPNDQGRGLQKDSSTTFLYQAQDASAARTNLSVSEQASLRKSMIELAKNRTGQAWETPSHASIPDPGGANWNQDLASKPDSADMLQNMINSQKVAMIPAGTYYIGKSLRIPRDYGMIGAGATKTLIIAKNKNIDMVIGDEHYGNPYSLSTFTLSDMTLQGGQNGIHHEPNGSGAGAQYTSINLSNVTFRDMAHAGIFMDRIFSWDNVMLDHINFVNNAVGFRQKVDPAYAGGDKPGMSYIDKSLFYKCQFISNGIGVDLPANRANNLNVWYANLFKDNVGGAFFQRNSNSNLIVNSDFINNGGDAVVSGDGNNLGIVSSRFTAGANGKAMVNGRITIEGSTFSGSNALINRSGNGNDVSIFNSYSADMSLGNVSNGYFFNNQLMKNAEISVEGAILKNGTANVLLPGKVTQRPSPQLLFGSQFSFDY